VGDEFADLDRLLRQLAQVLEVPGDDVDASPELSWQKLDLMYGSMGPDALGALLRRQGLDRSSTAAALSVLSRRHRLMS
jgi:hypothetical protein